MVMLRSAIRLAFRQSAPASRFFGNVGRCNPTSSITSKRNYFHSNEYDLRKEDFMDWDTMGFLFRSIGFTVGIVFYHKVKNSRDNTSYCEKISTSERGHYGQEKAEKNELSEASISN